MRGHLVKVGNAYGGKTGGLERETAEKEESIYAFQNMVI